MRDEGDFRKRLKKHLGLRNIEVLREFVNSSPDMVIKWNGKTIGVELKTSAALAELEKGMVQLLLAKKKFDLDSLWLILEEIPSRESKEIIELMWTLGITPAVFALDTIIEITSENFWSLPSTGERSIIFLEKDVKIQQTQLTPRMNEILEILKEKKEISFEELREELGVQSTSHIRGLISTMKRRIDQIETFHIDRKGWVRLRESSHLGPSDVK